MEFCGKYADNDYHLCAWIMGTPPCDIQFFSYLAKADFLFCVINNSSKCQCSRHNSACYWRVSNQQNHINCCVSTLHCVSDYIRDNSSDCSAIRRSKKIHPRIQKGSRAEEERAGK